MLRSLGSRAPPEALCTNGKEEVKGWADSLQSLRPVVKGWADSLQSLRPRPPFLEGRQAWGGG